MRYFCNGSGASIGAAGRIAHYNRGTALCSLARYEEAVTAFDRTLSTIPPASLRMCEM